MNIRSTSQMLSLWILPLHLSLTLVRLGTSTWTYKWWQGRSISYDQNVLAYVLVNIVPKAMRPCGAGLSGGLAMLLTH